jgi:hypothetical protein
MPASVDPSSARPWDLETLNQAIQAPGFQRPREPVTVTGVVVSVFRGSRYSQVLSLAPAYAAAGSQEVMLCLVEKTSPPASPGTAVTVAGYLDPASIHDNLILTSATIARP